VNTGDSARSADAAEGAAGVATAEGTATAEHARPFGASTEAAGASGGADPARAPVARPGAALWIATVGGVGFGPWAPGTWGALVAVAAFALGLPGMGLVAYAVLVALVVGIGIWASDAVEPWMGKADDGRIVIDEVAGQLITLAPLVALHGLSLGRLGLPEALASADSALAAGIDAYWLLVVTAFVAFRWFDIRKPGPVKWAEQRFKGGLGVMADDIVAGLMGAVVVMAPAYVLVVMRLREHLPDAAGWFA